MNKKIGLILSLLCITIFMHIFTIGECLAEEITSIDKKEIKCVKKAKDSVKKAECVYDSMNDWQEIIDKDLDKFNKLIPKAERETFKRASDNWGKYIDNEFMLVTKVVYTRRDKDDKNEADSDFIYKGACYKRDVLKHRALELDNLIKLMKNSY